MEQRRSVRHRNQAQSVEQLRAKICAILEDAALTMEERIQALGGAMVIEAVKPFSDGAGPDAAHQKLRAHDPELAAAVEAIAPMIHGRAIASMEAQSAIAEIEKWLS